MEAETKTLSKAQLIDQLQKDVETWQERTFNHIQLEVVECWAKNLGSDSYLGEYISHPSVSETVYDWIHEKNEEELIEDFLLVKDVKNWAVILDDYRKEEGNIKESFIKAVNELTWNEFLEWCSEEYEDDIQEYIYEQENYPLWNTLFEFKDSAYNHETLKCMQVGLGVIEGLEPFNNMVFMTSGGHSFFSTYWIPLYLSLHNYASDKYSSLTPSDYGHL